MKRRRRKRKRPKIASVQMAPMIDMVFLLLVFFMTVSSISQAGMLVEVDLPDSSSATVPDDLSGRVLLSVKTDKSLYLGARPIAWEDLDGALQELIEADGVVSLRIRADRDTVFADIRSVMQTASDAGISNYIYGAWEGDR